jgi:hypothetical protein
VITVEVYTAAPAPPETLWHVVGDLRRLPEWTDADRVEDAPETPAVGDLLTTVAGGQRMTWRVATAEPRLLELVAHARGGVLGLGASVLADPTGARLILAGAFEPAGRAAAVRFRLRGRAALRARFDRWATAAVRLATAGAG